MHTLASIITAVFTLIVIGYIAFCADNLLNLRSYRVGYTGSDLHLCTPVLQKIIEKYDLEPKTMTFVEPGAGFAGMTRCMAKRYKWKDLIALELRPFTMLIARLANLKQRAPIQFVRRDVMRFKFPKGSFIYSYLSTPMIERLYLEGKFDSCFLVSLTFALPGVRPTEEIRIPSWQQRIWVYDFRKK
jgi:hypothetical protein